MAAKLEKLLRIFAYLMGKDYFCIRFYTMGFRSSVGLEQQPSKLWVLGSNPNGITSNKKEEFLFSKLLFHFYIQLFIKSTCRFYTSVRGKI